MDRDAYLTEIITAFRTLHGCEAEFMYTVPVKETFRGKTAWEGDVELFKLAGHPKTSFGYGWGFPNEKRGGKLDVVTVLELPPVGTPEDAVKAYIAATAKGAVR
jgi:hypothetical protein